MIPKAPFAKFLKHVLLLIAILSVGAVSYCRLFDNYELGSLDLRFVLRIPKIPTTDKIVFIEIGQDTIDKLGRFPFDRNYHALLIKALSESGARTILLDILFSEPQEHDRELEYALDRAGNVYLPYAFDLNKAGGASGLSAGGYVAKSLEGLAKAAKGTGHINIIPDPDGKFRRIPPFIKYQGADYPHIAFLMGCDHLGLPLKSVRVPLDEDFNMIINFSGKWSSSYGHYSYVDVLQSSLAKETGQKPILDLGVFKDKICIVGLTATGTGDVHPTPFESIYPGMGVHAEIINSIINNKFITRASKKLNLAILLALGFLISVITFKTKPVHGLFILFLTLAFFAAAAILLFNYSGIWIDVAYPVLLTVLLYLSFTLYKYITEWKNRIVFENELGIAKKIQESFLPKSLPATAGLEISAKMHTARQVGGDLYDFIEFSEHRLGLMIGDVSGKGVPASLFMAMVTGAFKFFAATDTKPNDTLNSLNEKLVKESSSGLFVTVFYAIFDLQAGTMLYGNGGHLPALFLRANEGPRFLDTTEGAPLGLMEGNYSPGSTDIRKDDTIVFYTDGVTEAMNSKREMYGKERLSAVARKNRHLASREILAAIEKDVRGFEPKSEQHDDITIIVVKVK